MAKIKSPNTDYNGVSASLTFVKGEAETDDGWLIDWFKSNGYEVIEPDEKAVKALNEMTHDELDEYALEQSVPEDGYPKSGNKTEKVKAIEAFLVGE